jgi:hypothetical protein
MFFGSLHIIVSSLVTYHQASSLTLQQRTVPPTQIASAPRYAQLALCTQEYWPTIYPKYLFTPGAMTANLSAFCRSLANPRPACRVVEVGLIGSAWAVDDERQV